MKKQLHRSAIPIAASLSLLLLFVVWVLAQEEDEETSEEECEWHFQGNHTSTDAKGHFWNECTGELYYVVGTTAQRANVNTD